jgi:hypothetical protein
MHPLKGRKQSTEHIEKRAAANRGLKRSEETRRKLSESHKGQITSEEARRRSSIVNKGNKYGALVNRDDEYKARMSESLLRSASRGENHYTWKGGDKNYWHRKARELFGKECCGECEISRDESKEKFGRDLEMHCTGSPKDYTLLENGNWVTLCASCHTRLEYALGNLTGLPRVDWLEAQI